MFSTVLFVTLIHAPHLNTQGLCGWRGVRRWWLWGHQSRVCRPSITRPVLPTQLSRACIMPPPHLHPERTLCSLSAFCVYFCLLSRNRSDAAVVKWLSSVFVVLARGVIWLKVLAQHNGCWKLMKLVGNKRHRQAGPWFFHWWSWWCDLWPCLFWCTSCLKAPLNRCVQTKVTLIMQCV